MIRRLAVAGSLVAAGIAFATPAHATTPCETPGSHVWCGLGWSAPSYVDPTFHWWELGLGPIVGHGHAPEGA
jgi:hypothetical protein